MIKTNRILAAYRLLERRFGPQGWWPTTPPRAQVPIYTPKKSVGRLSEQEQFEICLGSILTQNTNWTNVTKVLSQLSSRQSLHMQGLMKMPLRTMEQNFKSSGYFRQKARRVKNFLKQIDAQAEASFSRFFEGSVSEVRAKLLAITGVGPETADSMLLYAGGHPSFVVDAYTRRVGERWGILDGTETYDEIQKRFVAALPRSADLYAEYHALLVKLGKDFCHKREPNCASCPLSETCRFGRGRQA